MKFTYDYYTLKNGLKVLLMPSDTVNSATVSAWIKSGSANESDKYHGITHFLEHVALTASKSWPTKEILNESTEFNGSKFNASTSHQSVNYYINVPFTKVPFGVQFIYEALYECTLNPEYIEQERKIILDEISKIEDSIGYQARDFMWNLLTKKNSRYIKSIAGTQDSVKSFSIEDIESHYKSIHSPNKVLLSVVGNFDIKEIKKQIEDLFGKQKETDKSVIYPEEEFKSGIVKSKKSPKTDLVITTLEIPSLNSEQFTQEESNYIGIFESVLCGPMSSRLKKRLREKENLLYSIDAGVSSYQTFGYSYVDYDIPQDLFEKTLRIALEELEIFYEKGPTEKELTHYKEYMANRIIIAHDNVFSYIGPIRSDLFWDRPVYDIDQTIDIIKNATLEDVNSMIKKCMNINKLNGFAFGNVTDETESIMKDILKKYI